MIVGRQLESTFPPKPTQDEARATGARRRRDLTGQGFSDVTLHGPARRDHRRLGHRGQRPERRAPGPGGPHSLQRIGPTVGGTSRVVARPAQALGVPPRRPARRGPDDDALGARERGPLRPGPVPRDASCSTVVARTPSSGPSSTRSRSRRPHPRPSVSALSGGNQQKVVLARALLPAPAIVLADEPTQGVDVGARAEIYRILREVSATASRWSSPPRTPRSSRDSATACS